MVLSLLRFSLSEFFVLITFPLGVEIEDEVLMGRRRTNEWGRGTRSIDVAPLFT